MLIMETRAPRQGPLVPRDGHYGRAGGILSARLRNRGSGCAGAVVDVGSLSCHRLVVISTATAAVLGCVSVAASVVYFILHVD